MTATAPRFLIGGVCACLLVGCSAVVGSTGPEDQAAAVLPPPAADGSETAPVALSVDAGSAAVNEPVRPEVVIPDAWDSEVEELFGRYWLYWEAFAAAHAPPNADPSFAPLRELSTDENWRSLVEQLQGFAEDGLVLVLPERSVSEHLLRLPNATVLSGEEGAEAIIQDCWIDDFVQQTVAGQVIAETREAKLMNVTMRVAEGDWRVDGVTRAGPETDGYEQCQTLVTP